MIMRSREQGSTLIMLVGIIAALAILGASLIALTSNMMANSSSDQQQKKAFNVAEAGLDSALFKLGSAWPDESHPVVWSSADSAAFRDQFDTSLFPDPHTGSFSSVTFYDNSDTNDDGVIGPGDASYDAGPGAVSDGLMYVEVQSGVGKRAARIQAQVERIDWDMLVPRGIAVAADGELYANNHKQPIGVEVLGPDQEYAVIKSGTEIDDDVYKEDVIQPQENLPLPVVDSIMPTDIILDLIAMAKANGSYYSGNQRPDDKEDWEGLVVIQTSGVVNLDNQDDLNSDGVGENAPPGILIVVGPNFPAGPPSVGIDVNGHGEYWGLVYTDGSWRNSGTSEVHGMLLAKGTITTRAVTMQGDRDVLYNDNCIVNLNRMIVLNARIVPNTWREIKPVAGE